MTVEQAAEQSYHSDPKLFLSGEECWIEGAKFGYEWTLNNQWVSVETPPELTEHLMGFDDNNHPCVLIHNYQATVFAYNKELGVFKARYTKNGHWDEISSVSSKGCIPTHWQPLPKPPKP